MRVLLIDTNHPLLQKGLEKLGCTCDEDYTSSKREIASKIHNYEGIVIRSRFKIDKHFLDAASNLKFIARVGAGLESIDEAYAAEQNIQLISAPEGNSNAVGEHALGMLLSLFNNIKQADLQIRNGIWEREGNRGVELEGKTVGIIGYGNMGKAFSKKLIGFNDVKVICYDILPNVGDGFAKQVSLETLKAETDVLSIHTPFNELSHKMINDAFIQNFAKPIYLINTARGTAVVTDDLVKNLKSKKVLGACLDVLEYEKLSFENLFENDSLPDAFNYLIKADNVLLSPHVAGWTLESKVKLAETIVSKVQTQFFSKNIQSSKKKDRVTGIGGLFFKTDDPKKLKTWYREHLGFNTDDWGCTFWWKSKDGIPSSTQWSPFTSDTNYFEPSTKDYMFNYRVADLEGLMKKLTIEGVTIVGEIKTYEYGKFGWIMDPDGNKIELWEPVDSAF